MKTNEKIELLKYSLGRYDHYVESSQSKANLFLALSTTILVGVVTLISSAPKLDWEQLFALSSLGFLSIVSIILTLMATVPYRKGAKKGESVFFFKDVSNGKKEFKERLEKIDDAFLLKDLTNQNFFVAKGLNAKYNKLTIVSWMLYVQLSLITIYLLINLINCY